MEISTSPLVKTYKLQEFWELPEPPDHSFEAGNDAVFFTGDILKSEVLAGLTLAVARIFSA